ncbi:hypothetical protein F7725_012424 [Dissostichus mawsoni]|uniref:Uncharacterized protein n=1 Tax=Dissostichus mawsoni TaxID=36200 RepID=A0A7J5YMA2_DISMA|nr:hypothetical protein F7725_012424 [Dissostichus mawsoni]
MASENSSVLQRDRQFGSRLNSESIMEAAPQLLHLLLQRLHLQLVSRLDLPQPGLHGVAVQRQPVVVQVAADRRLLGVTINARFSAARGDDTIDARAAGGEGAAAGEGNLPTERSPFSPLPLTPWSSETSPPDDCSPASRPFSCLGGAPAGCRPPPSESLWSSPSRRLSYPALLLRRVKPLVKVLRAAGCSAETNSLAPFTTSSCTEDISTPSTSGVAGIASSSSSFTGGHSSSSSSSSTSASDVLHLALGDAHRHRKLRLLCFLCFLYFFCFLCFLCFLCFSSASFASSSPSFPITAFGSLLRVPSLLWMRPHPVRNHFFLLRFPSGPAAMLISSERRWSCHFSLRLGTVTEESNGGRTISECEEYSMFLSVRLAGLSSDHTLQEGLVELEGAGELPLQLVDAVEPLQEHGAALVHVLRVLSVAAAVRKLMTEVQPVGLHQNLEALQEDGTRY